MSLYLSISLAFSLQVPSQKPSAELSDVLALSFFSNRHASSSQKFFSLVQNSELNLPHEFTLQMSSTTVMQKGITILQAACHIPLLDSKSGEHVLSLRSSCFISVEIGIYVMID